MAPMTITGTARATRRTDAVHTFGGFDLTINGCEITRWKAGRARQLFWFLLVNAGHQVPKSTLIDVVWGESAGRSPDVSLKVAVFTLRALIADAHDRGTDPLRAPSVQIVSHRGGYALEATDLWVDVDDFEAHLGSARAHARTGNRARSVEHCRRAVELYRGPYLPECQEGWAALRRERLTDQMLGALTDICADARRHGDEASVLDLHQRILDIDPCREESYRELMRYHGVARQPSRVQHWYLTCIEQLNSRLGVQPDSDTRRMFYEAVSGHLVSSEAA